MLFKRGSEAAIATEVGDEEKAGAVNGDASLLATEPSSESSKNMGKPPQMTDVFSWQHLNYTVSLSGGVKRQLLNDISGYVAPGKLTALMGESGAGKVYDVLFSQGDITDIRLQTTLLNVLANRTDTGVVTGDRFVNGYELPLDFQAQT
jgi:ATP-binding cassette subfamily G (WHITE) protein 2 (SNQ2)